LNRYIDVGKLIENCYSSIVTILVDAAYDTIPLKKQNFYKYWWNEEVKILKTNSIQSHRSWVEQGKPRFGSFYDSKANAKFLNKNCLRQHKKDELSSATNELHDSFVEKDNVTFWKMWNNKLGGKKPVAICINGVCDDTGNC